MDDDSTDYEEDGAPQQQAKKSMVYPMWSDITHSAALMHYKDGNYCGTLDPTRNSEQFLRGNLHKGLPSGYCELVYYPG